MVLNTGTTNGRTEVLSFLQTAAGPAVPANRQSQLLSVWRKLHVEVDSMAAVPNSGSQANTVSGDITEISAGGASLLVSATLRDLSPDLDSPPSPPPPGPGNGRFENGVIFVGQTATTTYPVASNGSNFVVATTIAPFTLPFSMVNSTGGGLISGLVTRMEQISNATQFTINVSLTPSAYVGGTFTILGVSSPISANGVVTVITNAMVIPFTLHDDDHDHLMPYVLTGLDPIFVNAYRDCYIESVMAPQGNGTLDVFFRNILPLFLSQLQSSQMDQHRHNDYWVAYLLWVWQFHQDMDYDPDNESTPGLGSGRGWTVAGRWSGVAVESSRDSFINGVAAPNWAGWGYTAWGDLLWTTAADEVGHQFGLLDVNLGMEIAA
jgi:hypothetical protein